MSADALTMTPGPATFLRSSRSAPIAFSMMAKKKAAAGGKTVQVVLSEPIKGVGKKGELVTVKKAYAENFIVSGGKGKIATAETLDQIAADEAAAAADAAAAKAKAVHDGEKLTEAFGEEGCVITKKAGPDGSIFGKITAAELATAIKDQSGITIDKKAIEAPSAKALGVTSSSIKLHKEVVCSLKVVVAAE
eukprot:CAMPEP_0115864134 /NCGR_PEP_ID=MMETSP0287-20121206/19042_1 /TAXON_ID=412157 /ORGANISM="Chrysochromulina rotalis, Strain UIO044" /LENGTH=191 /DNA_ID=CAMNT_0003318591 /DNA_START=12 /DNA_END=587 /DNA_ORIENTATION=+